MEDMAASKSQDLALLEFNEYIDLLKEYNINYEIIVQKDRNAADSIFLNNWFSTHKNEYFPEGLLIIYPIKAVSRRLEKTQEAIEKLKKDYKSFLDFSYLENDNEFLESTGCLIFDYNNRKIYCCYSERATVKAVSTFFEKFNQLSKYPFELITFKATDLNGKSIYHTNCLMAILEHHVVICLNSITDLEERQKVIKSLEENRKIIEISQKQLENFCGNVINVKNNEGKTVVLMSQRARKNFTKRQISNLTKFYKILSTRLTTIEKVGGGSARCLVGELF